MYQIWRNYLDLWGHDCKKYVWPTFGCKLGQSDPIVMQLKLDMSCHLLNVYTKFQIDISKHVKKSPENADGRTDIATVWKSSNVTQIAPFRIVTQISIHQWVWNDTQNLKWHRIGALLFCKVIHQISRLHGTKNCPFWPKLSVPGL